MIARRFQCLRTLVTPPSFIFHQTVKEEGKSKGLGMQSVAAFCTSTHVVRYPALPKKLLLEQEKQLIMNYEPLTLKTVYSSNYECNTKVCKMQTKPAQIV